jgi:hypothetical protein
MMSQDSEQPEPGPPARATDATSESSQAAETSGAPELGDVGRRPPPTGLSSGARPKWSVRYPNAYVWFVFLAALDIMLTYLILHPVLFSRDVTMTESRGGEANVLASWVIERWDVPGMVAFKFVLVVLVVVLCEVIGRRKEETGRRIAEWAVAITVIPVVVALIQMGLDLYFWFYPPQ